MIKKLTLLAGFGAGYVLGAKAGTQRYDQIVAKAKELAGRSDVQDVMQQASQAASDAAGTVKAKANETIETVSSAVDDASEEVVDLTQKSSSTPAAGAAPSGTV